MNRRRFPEEEWGGGHDYPYGLLCKPAKAENSPKTGRQRGERKGLSRGSPPAEAERYAVVGNTKGGGRCFNRRPPFLFPISVNRYQSCLTATLPAMVLPD